MKFDWLFFWRRKKTGLSEHPGAVRVTLDDIDALFPDDREDHLGQAAIKGSEARDALQEARYDDAWRLLHEQKHQYAQHAVRSEFTPEQAIALDGSVHQALANILRLESRHREAFVHFLYFVASSSRRTKEQDRKLRAYLNRSGLSGVTVNEVEDALASLTRPVQFRDIQRLVEGFEVAG